MKVMALTCTGDRPRPLTLARSFLERSTIKPDLWMVVDDGQEPSAPVVLEGFDACPVSFVRRIPGPKDPKHTLPLNLLAALSHIPEDVTHIAFWEDDDWYSPRYLEWVWANLEREDGCFLLGQPHTPYYRVASREYAVMPNSGHSSLCATVAARPVFDLLASICDSTVDPFVDLHLWQAVDRGSQFLSPHRYVVGIKQLPGRPGSTMGWRGGPIFVEDPTANMLNQWVGVQDALQYLRMVET